ncbi:MAG: glycosyltransferase [Phycisphaeraceae bacterium]|nr:glycosyltransferase [Phycisphaeraceae bacterium]
MRVFMLGWEFPPFISGGLGTACYGLTKALSAQNVDITFVLPKPIGQHATSSHVRVLAPYATAADGAVLAGPSRNGHAPSGAPSLTQRSGSKTHAGGNGAARPQAADASHPQAFAHVTFKAVPACFQSPYGSGQAVAPAQNSDLAPEDQPISFLSPAARGKLKGLPLNLLPDELGGKGASRFGPMPPGYTPVDNAPFTQYTGDLFQGARRYARLCVDLASDEDFDVIHAHDWLTFPAGMAVAAATGKPLIVHVHSTEFDRSGENVNQRIYDIERAGVHAADRVVAVSHFTQSILHHRYGVPLEKLEVVYNGLEEGRPMPDFMQRATIRQGDKIVLFLGRITMQKGPEYFLKAARKVLEKMDNVKFVMAGSGDRVQQIIELAAAEGIGHRVLFTGFLASADVERVFRMADVYVMPSVSEPFGIAPLEAISHDVPVIISRTSGVSEVLSHALKVDFWDVNEIANKIIAVLKHPPLSTTLRQQADIEVRRLTWSEAARRCSTLYHRLTSTTAARQPAWV